jgi:hypothetical protein
VGVVPRVPFTTTGELYDDIRTNPPYGTLYREGKSLTALTRPARMMTS